MADYGHNETEKILARLERQIAKTYGDASKELQTTIDEYFAKFVERDKKQLALLEQGKITKQQYEQWRLAQIGRGKRFEALRDQLAERATNTNEVAIAYVNDATPSVYSLNRNYAAYTIEQMEGDVGFTLWDEQTVKRLIVEEPDLMPNYPKEKAVKRGIDLEYGKKQITASVTSGILQGNSIGKIAKDLNHRITDMSMTSAVRAARTAVTGAQNAGRQDSYMAAEKMGIKVRKRWVATKDGRTRHSHAMLDGQTVDADEPFVSALGSRMMFPGDARGAVAADLYNCRCTMRTVEKEGIEAEPRQMRVRNPETGENELVSEMTYFEWKDRKNDLQQEPQRAIIGMEINRGNNDRGKPSAVYIFDVDLNSKQQKLLELLPQNGSSVVVPKKKVSMKDLSALTAKTGNEFALFTAHGKRLVVRGNSTSVDVGIEKAKELKEQGYKWSGHTHPGADDLVRSPSKGDFEILKAFSQEQSAIYDSLGRFDLFWQFTAKK